MKGDIRPNHIPRNKGRLMVPGQPPFTFTTLGDISEELGVAEMPDRTKATDGQKKPVEFAGTIPMHHADEIAAIEVWFAEGQDPVAPTYKKQGTLIYEPIGFGMPKTFLARNLWISRRQIPGMDMTAEGDLQQYEVTFQADEIQPIT